MTSPTLIRGAEWITMADADTTPQRLDVRIVDGAIAEIAPRLEPDVGDTVLDGRGLLGTPGFVNAHTHSWEYLYKGRYDNLPLELWMLSSYPILGQHPLSPDLVRLRSQLFGIEAMLGGTTTLVDDVLEMPGQDAAQLAAVFEAYEGLGIRANVSGHIINRPFVDTLPFVEAYLPDDVLRDVRGQPLASADEYLAFSRAAFATHDRSAGGRLRYMVAPSGPQRCTDDLLVGAAELAREHAAECHIHVLETKVQAVTGQHLYGSTLVEHLHAIGAMGPQTTFAHGIWLTDADLDLVAETATNVSHNPISNLKLGSGVLPWRAYHDRGATLGLGTDGCSSSDTPRILEVVKMAALLHKASGPDYDAWPTVAEVLRAATIGGARTARLHESIGSIEVGKRADVVLFDTETLAFTPRNRLDHQLVYSENGSSIAYVLVDGVVTVDHGRTTFVDASAVRAQLAEVADEIRAHQDGLDRINRVFEPAFRTMHERAALADVGVHRWIGADASSAPLATAHG